MSRRRRGRWETATAGMVDGAVGQFAEVRGFRAFTIDDDGVFAPAGVTSSESSFHLGTQTYECIVAGKGFGLSPWVAEGV